MFKAQIAVLHLHCHGCIWILFWQGGDFVKVLHLPRLPGLTSLVSVCAGIPWSGGPTPLLQRFHHIIITFSSHYRHIIITLSSSSSSESLHKRFTNVATLRRSTPPLWLTRTSAGNSPGLGRLQNAAEKKSDPSVAATQNPENRENIDVLPVISLSRKLFGKRGKPLEAPFLFRSSSWSTPADLTHRLPSLVRGDPGIFICLRFHHVGPGCGYTDLRYYVFLGM